MELADALERFGGNGGFVRLVGIVEGAPGMRPAGGLLDPTIAVKMIESCVGVGLENAGEALEVLAWGARRCGPGRNETAPAPGCRSIMNATTKCCPAEAGYSTESAGVLTMVSFN